MNINTVTPNFVTSFTSRNNPIKPINVKSESDNITISEIDYDKDVTPAFITEITNFFCKNFMDNTKYLPLIKIRDGSPEEKEYYLGEFKSYYSDIFKSEKEAGNITMLTAKDGNNKLVGGFLAYPYHVLPKSEENTLYLDSLAVDPSMRGLHLAQIMMDETLEANKNNFTDAVLGSTPGAVKFYDRLGFKQFDMSDEAQKVVADEINNVLDYADCLTYYTKPLQPDSPRWYTVCAREIEKNKV